MGRDLNKLFVYYNKLFKQFGPKSYNHLIFKHWIGVIIKMFYGKSSFKLYLPFMEFLLYPLFVNVGMDSGSFSQSNVYFLNYVPK